MDYFEVYREIWQFHKQYIDRICNEDEFWEIVIADADKLYKKYDNSRFAKVMTPNYDSLVFFCIAQFWQFVSR